MLTKKGTSTGKIIIVFRKLKNTSSVEKNCTADLSPSIFSKKVL